MSHFKYSLFVEGGPRGSKTAGRCNKREVFRVSLFEAWHRGARPPSKQNGLWLLLLRPRYRHMQVAQGHLTDIPYRQPDGQQHHIAHAA